MTQESHRHGTDELCQTGMSLYVHALREGRVRARDVDPAPCLLDLGLLHPDDEDRRWLRPVAPAVALPRLLRNIEDEIALSRRREARLADAFQPLMALDAEDAFCLDRSVLSAVRGLDRINEAIRQAVSEASQELLTVQPGGARPPAALTSALPLEQEVLARGARMRTLYQHTSRHSPAVLAHFEQLTGDVEVRTLNEVIERLVVIDRCVAFIPASSDRTTALEVRHPALVAYLVTTFERLWDLATPMWPPTVQPSPPDDGITTRQRAIAALLIEGLTDEKIAARLGMNVRTVRVHIAKLAATLGTGSRAQLGYRIGQSGILERAL